MSISFFPIPGQNLVPGIYGKPVVIGATSNARVVDPRAYRHVIGDPSKVEAWSVGREPLLNDPNICRIFSKGTLRESCHDNDPGAGGGGDPAPKTFTQAELDSLLGKRLGEERKKFEGHEDFKAAAAKAKEFEAELTKLREEKELEGKSQAEKEKIAGEKARQAIERERGEFGVKLTAAEKRAMDAEGKLRNHIISGELSAGLDAAKVLPAARAKAVKLMLSESTVELDDNGAVSSIVYEAQTYKTVAEAAAAYLANNDFFAAAKVGGGSGAKPPNGAGSAPVSDGSSASLLAQGLASRRK